MLENLDIGNRVSVDQKQIRASARNDKSEFSGHPHQLSAILGRGPDRLKRRKPEKLNKHKQIARVSAMRVPLETIVSSRQHSHAPLPQFGHFRADGLDFLFSTRAQVVTGRDAVFLAILQAPIGQPHGRSDEYAVLACFQHVRSLLISKGGVIDHLDAVPDAHLHRVGRSRMGRHHPVSLARDLTHRCDFVIGHGRIFGKRVFPRTRRRGHDLEGIHPALGGLPAGLPELFGTVEDKRIGIFLADIAETAAHRHLAGGRLQARPRDIPGIDRVTNGDIRVIAGRTATEHAGEAVVEQQSGVFGRFKHMALGRDLGEFLERGRVQEAQMSMGIGHAGHQGSTCAIDTLCVRCLDSSPIACDLRDPVSPDQNLTGKRSCAGSVNHVHIDEKCL